MSGGNNFDSGGITDDAENAFDLDSLFVEDDVERVGQNQPTIVIADIEIPGVVGFTISGEGRESQYLRENETGTGGEENPYGADSPPPGDSTDDEGGDGGEASDDSGDEPPLNVTIDAYIGHRVASQLVALRGLDATFDVLIGDLVLEDMELHNFERRLTGEHPYAYEAHIEVQEWREYEIPGIDDYTTAEDYGGDVTPLPDDDLPEWVDSGEPGDPNVIVLDEGQEETFTISNQRVSNVIFDQSAVGASATLEANGQWRIEHVAFTGQVNTAPNIVTTGSGFIRWVYLEYGGIHHEAPDQVIHHNLTIKDSQQGALAPDAGYGSVVGTTPAEAIPDDADSIRRAHPDPRAAYNTVSATDYDGRTGDLAVLIRDASQSSDAVIDLGSGSYQVASSITGSLGSVVGVVGDGATIHYEDTDVETLFEVSGSSDVVMEGFTLDLTGDSGGGEGIPDIALANINTSGNVWARDVTVRGRRKRWQNGTSYGDLYNYNINLTDPDAVAHHYNVSFPDGLEFGENPDRGSTSQTIAFSADPPHEGTNVFEQCSVQEWPSNGFYTQNSPGRNYIIDCHAYNCARGQIRPGDNDVVIGGLSEADTKPTGRAGTSQLVAAEGNVEVYGLRIESTYHNSEAIQVRSDIENLLLEGVVVNSNYNNRVVRLSRDPRAGGRANVTIRNCHWYDGYEGSVGRAAVLIRDANVTVEGDFSVNSESSDEFRIERGSLTVNGQTYGDGTYENSELGINSVTQNSLPNYSPGE